jgi:hypothetical protein
MVDIPEDYPEIIVILSKKESKFAAWWITIMRGIADAGSYAYIIRLPLLVWCWAT